MRVRRSIWTFLAGQTSTVVTLLVALVATPLLLHWLGDERLGAVEATSDWIGYISLLEFGIGGALLPLFANALARRDESQVRTLLAAGARAYVFVSGLMLASGLLLLVIITRVLRVGPGLMLDLRLGCAISLLGIILVPLTPLRILLDAEQRGYVINASLLAQSLLITGASLFLAWAKFGISGQFAAILLGGLAFNGAMLWFVRDRLPLLRSIFTAKLKQTREWAEIWNLNWPTFAFNLCGRIGLVTDNIIVGGLLSPALVVPFLFTQQLAVLTQRQLQGVGNASWAALVELQVQGKHEIFNQRLIELTRLIAVLAVAALIPIIVYDHNFISLWIGARRYGGGALIIVAAVNAFLLAVFSLWAWCINGTGQVRIIMPGMIVQTAINFVFSIVLTLKLGLVGPLLGTTFGFLSVSIWYLPLRLNQCFATSKIDLFRAAGWPILSALPFAAAVWSLSRAVPVTGWIDMALEMSIAALGYLALWWLVGLTSGEKDLWLQRLNLLIPRGSY